MSCRKLCIILFFSNWGIQKSESCSVCASKGCKLINVGSDVKTGIENIQFCEGCLAQEVIYSLQKYGKINQHYTRITEELLSENIGKAFKIELEISNNKVKEVGFWTEYEKLKKKGG